MKNPLVTRGFERRLLVFFLLLSVTPTILIAIFGTRYFLGPVERISSPALRQSFSNSMEIARQFSARLEQDAEIAARQLAEEFIRSGFPQKAETLRGFLEVATHRSHVDFSALYVRAGDLWQLAALYPPDTDRLDSNIMAGKVHTDNGAQRIDFTDQDIIASGVVQGSDSLLIAGIRLTAGMTDRMRKTGDDLSLYGSAGQWVRSVRMYITITFAAIVVLAAVSSAALSRVLAGRISHPIRELARATDRIAGGDLDHRVTVKAKDEILSLVSSFNNMTQELQDNRQRIIAMATREAQVARDFEIARQVQQNLFPKALPNEPGWQFAATCRPAKAVGGDYYDVFEVAPGMVIFAQGDVSGKGLGASLVMASVHAIIRSWAGSRRQDLTKLIEELNHYLIISSSAETFVTLFVGLLDCASGKVWYLNCGHPPVIVQRCSDGGISELSEGGTILGIIPGDNYKAGEYSLAEGDNLVIVSDGVTEAMNPAEDMFEAERLVATVHDFGRNEDAGQMMDRIIQAVDLFAEGSEQADDISVLVLRRTARVASPGRTGV